MSDIFLTSHVLKVSCVLFSVNQDFRVVFFPYSSSRTTLLQQSHRFTGGVGGNPSLESSTVRREHYPQHPTRWRPTLRDKWPLWTDVCSRDVRRRRYDCLLFYQSYPPLQKSSAMYIHPRHDISSEMIHVEHQNNIVTWSKKQAISNRKCTSSTATFDDP